MGGEASQPEILSSAADLYRGLAFPAGQERPFVAVNMVASVDGRAVVSGRARVLSSPLDRLLMRRIRAAADCVLVGAATLRAEGYDAGVGSEESAERQARGMSPQPLAAVVSSTGELPRRRGFFRVAEQRAIVLTTAGAAEARREAFGSLAEIAEVATVPSRDERLSVGEILDALHGRYAVRRLLVEGGPRTVGELFAAGLVDELFLTISPLVVGGEASAIAESQLPHSPPARLALASAATDAGFAFLRYRVVR